MRVVLGLDSRGLDIAGLDYRHLIWIWDLILGLGFGTGLDNQFGLGLELS